MKIFLRFPCLIFRLNIDRGYSTTLRFPIDNTSHYWFIDLVPKFSRHPIKERIQQELIPNQSKTYVNENILFNNNTINDNYVL